MKYIIIVLAVLAVLVGVTVATKPEVAPTTKECLLLKNDGTCNEF